MTVDDLYILKTENSHWAVVISTSKILSFFKKKKNLSKVAECSAW